MSSSALLQELMQTHDADPAAAAEALRTLPVAAIGVDDAPRYSWLVNHVIGEQLHRWPEALALHRRFEMDAAPRAVLRNHAVAAILAGAPLDAWEAEAKLVRTTAATAVAAAIATRLGVLQYLAASEPPWRVAQALNPSLTVIAEQSTTGPLVDLLAGALNNVVSALLEHPDADTEDPEVRHALVEGAEACRTLWREAGTWLQHERAGYLVALCNNKVGCWDAALHAAQSGLDIIAANGSEDVDRAFLLLELGQACGGLGRTEARIAARNEAFTLAEQFDERGLRTWFESRAALT